MNAWELQLVSGEGRQPDRADEAAEAYCGQQVPAAPAPEVAACNRAALHQNGLGNVQHNTPAPEMQQVPVSAGLAITRSALLWCLSSWCLSLSSLAWLLCHAAVLLMAACRRCSHMSAISCLPSAGLSTPCPAQRVTPCPAQQAMPCPAQRRCRPAAKWSKQGQHCPFQEPAQQLEPARPPPQAAGNCRCRH